MNMCLIRVIYTKENTIGDLLINHGIFCHTLEDLVRPKDAEKVPEKTAIPAGRYRVILSLSIKFKRIMPEILNVPNFTGIRIHGGNTSGNTSGCILVANSIINDNLINGSMEEQLIELLKAKKELHWIEIVDTFPYTGL